MRCMAEAYNPGAQDWSLRRVLPAALGLPAASILGALLLLTLSDGAPWAAAGGWSIGALLVLVALRARSRRAGLALPLGPGGTPPLPALLTGFGAALLLDTLAAAGGSSTPTPELAALVGRPATAATWLSAALYVLLLQPLAEGLVFRGLLQPALQARAGRHRAILLTALAWVGLQLLVYSSAPTGASIGALVATRLAGGLLLGILRARSDSARASIFAHAGLNLFALLRLPGLGV